MKNKLTLIIVGILLLAIGVNIPNVNAAPDGSFEMFLPLVYRNGYSTPPSTQTITVLGTNDIHGSIYSGKIEYMVGYFEQVRAANPGGVLHVDAGDIFQRTYIDEHYKSESTIAVMMLAGMDAWAFGNHDTAWGREAMIDRINQGPHVMLGANVKYKANGEQPEWLPPYIIKDVNGIKVAIVGFAGTHTPSTADPFEVSDLKFSNEEWVAAALLPELEAQADVIIGIIHANGSDLACALSVSPKTAMVHEGHTHATRNTTVCGVVKLQNGATGNRFSRTDIVVDVNTKEILSITPQQIDVNDSLPISTAAADLIAGYEAVVLPILAEELGDANDPFGTDGREDVIGDWATDVLRTNVPVGMPEADFALIRVRGDGFDSGPVTYGELFSYEVYGNTFVVKEVTGTELMNTLIREGYWQVSGIRFIEDSPDINDYIDLNTNLSLQPDQTYFVAMDMYSAHISRDIDQAPETWNKEVKIRDVWADWIRENAPFDAPIVSQEMRIVPYGTPMGVDDAYSTLVDTPLTILAGGGLLVNDRDVDSASLTAVEITDPPNGSVEINLDGSFTYTPNPSFDGTDSFIYIVSDGVNQSNYTYVVVEVMESMSH